jgi:hypothetical protein
MHIALVFEALAVIIPALGGISGMLYAVGRWVGKVDENTKATDRLTAAFDKHADRVDAKLDDHDARLVVVETKLKIK